SIGAATVLATSLALAPGYAADTSTVGGAISGYWAIGSVNNAMLPPSVMTMDSTEAKIGRLMKKRENTSIASLPLLGFAGTDPWVWTLTVVGTVAVSGCSRPHPRPLSRSTGRGEHG